MVGCSSLEMEDTKTEAHLTSAAAFVEGGIQEACDDACSICLEAFFDSDPSTVTNCKHEYHLQCILEWCQRSSQCPMCWQPISLKDPTSQELLEGVERERERSFRVTPTRIFYHPTLGHFELQHLPVGVNDAELEERMIQHLTAASAMGRRHMARREGQRHRSSAQERPQFLVLSSHPNSPPASSVSSPTRSGQGESVSNIPAGTLSSPQTINGDESPQPILSSVVQTSQRSAVPPGSDVQQGNYSNTRRSPNQSSANSEDRAGPSELQTFSDSIRSKFNAVSMRYKESISKSTRGWKERLLSRNTTVGDIGSEVRREVNAGIATVSRMMEHLETKDNGRNGSTSSVSNNVDSDAATESNNQQVVEAGVGSPSNNIPATVEAPHATSSSSN